LIQISRLDLGLNQLPKGAIQRRGVRIWCHQNNILETLNAINTPIQNCPFIKGYFYVASEFQFGKLETNGT